MAEDVGGLANNPPTHTTREVGTTKEPLS